MRSVVKRKDGSHKGLKSDICKKYRDKYPDTPSRKLSKIIYKKESAYFKDEEAVRYVLRYIEGKVGSNVSDSVKKTKYFKEEPRPLNPYNLPHPDSEDLKPYTLPLSFNNFIIAADFHVPNHRLEPINAMLRYAKENNVKKLILNGDLLDNTPFTRWLHEPIDLKDVPRWFDMAKDLLVKLKTQFDEIIWLEGNHDFWYKRWLMEKVEILFHDKYYQLESRLGLNDIGVKFLDQRYLVKAGHLNIHHGHVLLRGGGTYANGARMLYMKSKSNFICSHLHVESSHTEPDVDDKIITTFITGCMCTLRPEYQPFGGKACHGFAHVTVKPSRDFSVKNFRVYKGEIL